MLDENVRVDLLKFLIKIGVNAVLSPKGASDKMLLNISKKERRVIVTNDKDFIDSIKKEVFSIILLQIPQKDGSELIKSFSKLLKASIKFPGKFVLLKSHDWEAFSIPKESSVAWVNKARKSWR